MAVHKHNSSHLFAHFTAIASQAFRLDVMKSGYVEHDLELIWQPHYDKPPTPPPDGTASLVFA